MGKILLEKFLKNKILKKQFFCNLTVIILALIAVFIGLTLYDAVPGGYKLFVVMSGSMQPAIRTGSVVVTKHAEQYKVGDVVTFGKNNGKDVPITHRIVTLNEVAGVTMFNTKGDANNAPDAESVRKETIQGRVLFSVPYAGYLFASLKTKQGLIVLIIIGTIIVYSELMRIQNEIRNMARKKKGSEVNKEKDEKTTI